MTQITQISVVPIVRYKWSDVREWWWVWESLFIGRNIRSIRSNNLPGSVPSVGMTEEEEVGGGDGKEDDLSSDWGRTDSGEGVRDEVSADTEQGDGGELSVEGSGPLLEAGGILKQRK